MKQYDKIYVPHPTGDYEVFEIGFEDPERGRLINEENVIVLTIEEAIEMWSAAERRDRWFFEMEEFEKQNLPEPPDFRTYLKSKSIEI